MREMTLFAEQYDFAISLLLLDDALPFASFEAEDESDVFEKMMPQKSQREW